MKKYLASGNHLYPDSIDDEFQSWDRVYLASDVDELVKVLRELTAELPEKIPDGMPPLAYWMSLATAQRHIARKALSLMASRTE